MQHKPLVHKPKSTKPSSTKPNFSHVISLITRARLLITAMALLTINASAFVNKPKIQLATIYSAPDDISHYWISEKLDGVRGYWDGYKLRTKQGNIITTPVGFTQHWPAIKMDGELWASRNQFDQTSGCIRQKIPSNCWQQIKLHLFDLPEHQGAFSERINAMKALVNRSKSPTLRVIKQYKALSIKQLFEDLDNIVAQHGEGLMLHHQDAKYKSGRSNDLMKLKKYQDAEARVIRHIEGKGKFNNMLGSIEVITPDGIIFKIGSGFSNAQRQNPPKVGETITYKYVGKTKRGVPRFASFMRIRTPYIAH